MFIAPRLYASPPTSPSSTILYTLALSSVNTVLVFRSSARSSSRISAVGVSARVESLSLSLRVRVSVSIGVEGRRDQGVEQSERRGRIEWSKARGWKRRGRHTVDRLLERRAYSDKRASSVGEREGWAWAAAGLVEEEDAVGAAVDAI